MSDDKRSPDRVGKPLVYGEIIITEAIFMQYMKQSMDEGFNNGVELAAKFIDEVARRSIGRAAAPIDLPWVAKRIRALTKSVKKD